MEKFNGNGLWSVYSQAGSETLSVSVYNGIASIALFRRGADQRRPVSKVTLHGSTLISLVDLLKELKGAQPNTRLAFTQLNYNKENRSYEQATNYVFCKDERGNYSIEVTSPKNSTPVKFPIRGASTYTTTGDQMTDEKKGELGIRELIKIFEFDVPCATLLSRFGMDNLSRRGGNGNNRGNGGAMRSGGAYPNRNNGAGGNPSHSNSADPYRDTATTDDENLF